MNAMPTAAITKVNRRYTMSPQMLDEPAAANVPQYVSGVSCNGVFSREAATLRGGVRIRGRNATWPFATCVADHEWAKVSSIVGTVWVARAETSSVRIVRGLMGTGVLFRSDSGVYDGLVFWTFAPKQVRTSLGRLGWPVAA